MVGDGGSLKCCVSVSTTGLSSSLRQRSTSHELGTIGAEHALHTDACDDACDIIVLPEVLVRLRVERLRDVWTDHVVLETLLVDPTPREDTDCMSVDSRLLIRGRVAYGSSLNPYDR